MSNLCNVLTNEKANKALEYWYNRKMKIANDKKYGKQPYRKGLEVYCSVQVAFDQNTNEPIISHRPCVILSSDPSGSLYTVEDSRGNRFTCARELITPFSQVNVAGCKKLKDSV